MSISSQISRISGNVAAALTAIANKGVTVPSGSNSDDLSTLIGQISGGGGTGALSDVVETLPGGGEHHIITGLDISDTTAVASDVASGKYFYTADGTKTQGTASGGGTGAVVEQGEVTVETSTMGLTIPFSGTHSTPPCFFAIAMETSGQTFSQYPSVVLAFSGCNFVDALGVSTIETKSSSPYHMCGQVFRTTKSSSSMSHTTISCTTDAATKWSTYVSNVGFNMPTADTYYGTYKWIAIWNSWGG